MKIELWDDCIDRDQPLIPSTVHTVFFGLLVGIPVNVFYRTNMPYLAGLMVASINAWWDANVTTAAQAISVLKRLARIIIRRIL